MIQLNSGTIGVTSLSKRSLADLHPIQLILDVVKANIDFGIFSIRDYCSIEIRGGQH
jgi:hypothetical protein